MTQTLTATQWIDTCSTSEIDEEDVMRWDHGGRTFAIYHSPDGEFFATDGLCTHENVHLAGGLVMDHVQRLEAIGCFGAELEVVSDRLGEWT